MRLLATLLLLYANAAYASGYDSYTVRDSSGLHIVWRDHGERYGSISKLKDALEAQGKVLRFATNAGIFDPSYMPLGLYIEDGETLVPLNTHSGEGNFYLQPNGVFYVDAKGMHIVDTQHFPKYASVTLATQSGPLLVVKGKINPAFKQDSQSRYIRSAVGLTRDREAVFVISREPVSFYEFSEAMIQEFKCPDALYLDGSISKFYASGTQREDTDGNFAAMIAAY